MSNKITSSPLQSKITWLSNEALNALAKLKIYNLMDLVTYLPYRYVERKINPDLTCSKISDYVVLDIKIEKITCHRNITKITCSTKKNHLIDLVFFARPPSLFLKTNKNIRIEGELSKYDLIWQILHPKYITNTADILAIEPIYRLRSKITNRTIHSYIQAALDKLPEYEEENPLAIKYNWPSFNEALNIIHKPKLENNLENNWQDNLKNALKRLASDELIAYQYSLAKLMEESPRKIYYPKSLNLHEIILNNLGFKLSDSQAQALAKIESLQNNKIRMSSLLQGDVGSGKTLVALLSMINVLAVKRQVALMVPTELLAKQHYHFIMKALQNTDIKIGLMSGSQSSKEKLLTIEDIANSRVDLVIGTHSLFQEKVTFADLAYVVIDEQHKFGVNQRLELLSKGYKDTDLLIITATPIPRSLALTLFHTVPIAKIENSLPGRKKIHTTISSINSINKIIESLARKIQKKEKIYWITPSIESDKLINVEERAKILMEYYHDEVGVLHGKMKASDQHSIMNKFITGEINILVATTIIEVGIDVPDATLMVIEHADYFGLSGLHQLRGRIGRSNLLSHCILLYTPPISDTAIERLTIIKNSQDGFFIAEQDLEMRGSGEILGEKQSGKQKFYFVNLAKDSDLLTETAIEAKKILKKQELSKMKFFQIFYDDDEFDKYIL